MPADPAGASPPTLASADSGRAPRARRRRPVSRGLQRLWAAAWDRATVDRLLKAGLPIVGLFMLLTAVNLGGQIVLWENAHWTSASFLAATVATSAAYRATGLDQRLRGLVAIGVWAWFAGQLMWIVQTAVGYFSIPAPSDVGFLLLVPPVILALVLSIRGRVPRAEELAVYLDTAAIFLAITAALLAWYGDQLAGVDTVAAAVTVAYPILHLATAGAGLIAVLAARTAFRIGGPYLLLAGFAVLGFAWVEWLRQAVDALPVAGSPMNFAFSIGMLAVGIGGAGWHQAGRHELSSPRLATLIHGGLPLVALLGSAGPHHAQPRQHARARSGRPRGARGDPPCRCPPDAAGSRARSVARRLGSCPR